MAATTVRSEVDGRGVARITLDRAAVHNALDEHVIRALTESLATAGSDPAVRVVVLTGAGKSFCAGGDLGWMRRTADYGFEENLADARGLGALLRTLDRLPRPTVALVNGAAYGGGAGLVACCDIAIAADTARFRFSEVTLGLIPATISPYVVRRIGEGHARRLFLTAETFDAAEAHRISLVDAVAPAEGIEATTADVIERLLEGGPAAQAAAKDLVAHVAGAPLDDRLIDWTARRIAEVRATGEGKEGTQAFLDKRPPRWRR